MDGYRKFQQEAGIAILGRHLPQTVCQRSIHRHGTFPHQLGDAGAQSPGKVTKPVGVRQADAPLPAANRLKANPQAFHQLLLAEAHLFPQASDSVSHAHVRHLFAASVYGKKGAGTSKEG